MIDDLKPPERLHGLVPESFETYQIVNPGDIVKDATRIGYEVSFTRHFYKPQPLRTLEEISADILAIEKEAEGLLDGLLKVGAK